MTTNLYINVMFIKNTSQAFFQTQYDIHYNITNYKKYISSIETKILI